MDAGVVAGYRPQAFASRTAAENFLNRSRAPGVPNRKFSAAGRNATAAAESRAGPSTSFPLLPDAPRHRLRRGALYPALRRSPLDHRRQAPGSRERRLRPAVTHPTPFFGSLLEDTPSVVCRSRSIHAILGMILGAGGKRLRRTITRCRMVRRLLTRRFR